MERLTIRNSDGTVSQPTGTTVEAVFYRLPDYEDTTRGACRGPQAGTGIPHGRQ